VGYRETVKLMKTERMERLAVCTREIVGHDRSPSELPFCIAGLPAVRIEIRTVFLATLSSALDV
jgi:hypothetical protein